MIYHGIRLTFKPDTTPEQRTETLESLRDQGRAVPSVRSFAVGRDHGGEYEWAADFAIEDLDGYREYLAHPARRRTDRLMPPLVEESASFAVTDDPDPEMAAQIAHLRGRPLAGPAANGTGPTAGPIDSASTDSGPTGSDASRRTVLKALAVTAGGTAAAAGTGAGAPAAAAEPAPGGAPAGSAFAVAGGASAEVVLSVNGRKRKVVV
ncbi:Dabb family protein, partial [Actinomadura welshii]